MCVLIRHTFHERPKWITYKHESDKNKNCLSVGNFGILRSEIFTKSSSRSFMSQIFDFRDRFYGQVGNTALCLKIISQKWTAFSLDNKYCDKKFTEFVSNQYTHFYILTCQMLLQVMECPLILLRFLGIFIRN